MLHTFKEINPSQHKCQIDCTNHDEVINKLQTKSKDLYYFWRNYQWLYIKYYNQPRKTDLEESTKIANYEGKISKYSQTIASYRITIEKYQQKLKEFYRKVHSLIIKCIFQVYIFYYYLWYSKHINQENIYVGSQIQDINQRFKPKQMLVKALAQKSLILSGHKSLLIRSAVVLVNSPQINSYNNLYFAKLNYCMSSKKKINPKKLVKQVPAQNSQQQSVDISSVPINQQIHMLKQQILQLISQKADDRYLNQLIEHFSNSFVKSDRIKDGLSEFDELARTIRSVSAFKASTNYHSILTEYRYFLIKAGRIEQAILVTEECYNLLNRHSKSQDAHSAHQLCTLAILNFDNKNLVQARKYLQLELKANLKICDETYTQSIQAKNNLAIIDFCQGHYQESQKLFLKNQEIAKRILRSNPKVKQIAYLKHLAYLEAITSKKIKQSQDLSSQSRSNNRIKELEEQISLIIKSNQQISNDLCLYYETIAEAFLRSNQNELCLKFARKAITILNKKVDKPLNSAGKAKKIFYQIKTNIARNRKNQAKALQNLKQFKKASQTYVQALQLYQNQVSCVQSKQHFALKIVDDLIDCCRSFFYMQFEVQNKSKLDLSQSIRILQVPLFMWNQIVSKLWNIPKRIIFIPYELNIQIGTQLLAHNMVQNALQYFRAGVTQVQRNKDQLCKKSVQNLASLKEYVRKIYLEVQNLTSEHRKSLDQIIQKLSKCIQK